MGRPLFSDEAWDHYLYWQTQDKKTLKRLNEIIKDISRNGNAGIGKRELLTGDMSGWWSRRIDEKNRLIYRLLENDVLEIYSCKEHYEDK
jgi:toxin YoeB